ncbi:uncharacterized protein [Nicotiana sylvestris]|uniref:uncharacterized protein n=1 Tax=Nicotiana sylvestris TaxID=4096 RepID=UPI00388C4746
MNQGTTASDCSAAKSPENSQHGSAGDGSPSREGTGEIKQQRVGSRPRHHKYARGPHKRIESSENKIEANDKKVENYNSWVDQIPSAPPILKGVDSKKFIQRPFPEEVAPKPIAKKFRMQDLPKYNATSDSNEHVTTYTCAVKGNDLKDDEIKSVLQKKFGKTLLKGAMMWYHNLDPNSIDAFTMLADSFIKAHTGTIKVATRKSDVFKFKQRENEKLQEFVFRFQIERMELPLVSDEWEVQAFTQSLNERSSVASKQLKRNLIEYPTVTWSDIYN